MATLLKNEGYHISVVTPKIYKGSHYFEEQNGIKVYRFPFFARDKLLIEHKKIPYLRMSFYYTSGFFLSIYALFRNRCNIIHTHWAIPTGLIGAWISGFLRRPTVVTIHGSDLRMALEKPGFVRKVFAYVCKNASQINCVSEVQKKELGQLGIPKGKISTIPMGIDEEFLERGENRGRGLKKGPFTIVSNRNLLPIYNVSLLIRAIPIVLREEPETKFIIAGDGAEKETLEKEVKNLNIYSSVMFVGRIPHEEMPDLLSRSDIYVSTSLYDGASVSLLEAMGSGAFPIVTDIPPNREWIVPGENGFLVPVDEEKLLAMKIIDAIRDRALLVRSRKENQSLIKERVLWSVSVEKIKKMYSQLSIESRSSK
jgi:glycosyltransferase involved in cell wall biosynthesis